MTIVFDHHSQASGLSAPFSWQGTTRISWGIFRSCLQQILNRQGYNSDAIPWFWGLRSATESIKKEPALDCVDFNSAGKTHPTKRISNEGAEELIEIWAKDGQAHPSATTPEVYRRSGKKKKKKNKWEKNLLSNRFVESSNRSDGWLNRREVNKSVEYCRRCLNSHVPVGLRVDSMWVWTEGRKSVRSLLNYWC